MSDASTYRARRSPEDGQSSVASHFNEDVSTHIQHLVQELNVEQPLTAMARTRILD